MSHIKIGTYCTLITQYLGVQMCPCLQTAHIITLVHLP